MSNAVYLPHTAGPAGELRATLEQWSEAFPKCPVFALLPEAEQGRVAELQDECSRLGVTLAGALFPALIHAEQFVTTGMWLLHTAPGSSSALISDLDGNAATTAGRIVAAVRPLLGGAGATLFMVFDAMVPNLSSILDEVYLELGDAVRYLGVNAGSETFQPMACLFDTGRRLGNGVLCLLLPPDMEAALAHGYQAPVESISVTASVGNRIASINWQPAFEVYRARINHQYDIDLNRENFYQHAGHFPFGIVLADGETLVRIPVGLDADGAIHCVGEVPEYAVLALLQGPRAGSLDTVRNIARRLPRAGAGDVMLSFYCAGRRMHLGESAEAELAALARETATTLAGALSLGEIGSLNQGAYPHFHNGTVVCAHWNPA